MIETELGSVRIARALISVSDKSGIVPLCRDLHVLGVELIATGGTAALLGDAGLPIIEVAEYTGFPEMMGGRIKTLHPRVHGGILGRRGTDDAIMAEHDIPGIDLVVVNLYPFQQTVAKPACALADAIENIDIGGPAMLRSAAKNYASVAVLVDPNDYSRVTRELNESSGKLSAATRFELAAKCFAHTADYDRAVATYLAAQFGDSNGFPRQLTIAFSKAATLRYGENPHQAAACYVEPGVASGFAVSAQVIQGKELSFNNIMDADTALECVKGFAAPACVIVKHANPCGVATGESLQAAYVRAYAADPVSAFGGIIAFNRALDAETVQAVLDRQFVEVLIAPEVNDGARALLIAKPNLRVLQTGLWSKQPPTGFDLRRIRGGLLVQAFDVESLDQAQTRVVSQRAPTQTELNDLSFAWQVAKFVKSNAVVYACDGRTIGIGAGQMSRVDAARLAAMKASDAGLETRGAVLASDAFFPFRDGVDAAASAGVTAIIQPGGSVRDSEVIEAADSHGIAMVFTGIRHFRH